MSYPASDTPTGALPRWLTRLLSAAIAFHLSALFIKVLAAPSGPWLTNEGPGMATPPQLAFTLNEQIARPYLKPLKMTHNYHFASNRSVTPRARLVVRLYDAAGEVVETLQFPDPKACIAVRHRQELLTRWLVDDQPVQAAPGEYIPAPGQAAPTVPIWDLGSEPRQLRMQRVPEHLVPRDRPVMRPSDWSLLLVRSYARYVCRAHGAAEVEVVRHSREPLAPAVLMSREARVEGFEELVSNYGRLSK